MSPLLSSAAVRSTCGQVFQGTLEGQGHFNVHLEKLPALAEVVIAVIRSNYPDLNIPYHSRWGHFRAGDKNRLRLLEEKLKNKPPLEKARCYFDLVVPSVLLDAGAGAQWKFRELQTGLELNRSEGLGVASFHMYLNGELDDLENITAEDVARAFQVSDSNPLTGLEGRAGLIRSLGRSVQSRGDVFKGARVGGMVDFLKEQFGHTVPAPEVLKVVLHSMSEIWPGRIKSAEGVNLGDVWEHPEWGHIAFHKLSQWLTYSLLEPLQWTGFQVTDVNELTGLAEYRNGGLFVDGGVLQLKDENLLEQAHLPGSEVIVEWRALTVCLLDEIAPLVREKLGVSEEDFPLAKVLEGGTWWAGRKLAAEKRSDSSPPIKIISDGTVF